MLDSFYMLLLFLILFIEIFRKKETLFDFLTLFNIVFFLMYPLSGFLLAFDFEKAANSLALRNSLYANNIQTALAIYAGYFSVLSGFYSRSAAQLGSKIIIKERGNKLNVFVYAIFLLLFSCLCVYIYGLQFGNLSNALQKAYMIRGGSVERGPLVFFARLMVVSPLASYLLYSFLFIKMKLIRKIYIYITFTFAVIVTLIVFTLTASRGGILYYIVVLSSIYLIKQKRISWGSVAIIVWSGAVFIIYGKNFFLSLTAIPDGYDAVINKFVNTVENEQANDFNFYNLMGNFQYTVTSLDVALSKEYQFRWFVDIFYAFLSLIPERLTGIPTPETIMYDNSRYIIGNIDFWVPTGFLAFGIYSMWWPGLIIFCFTYGWIGRYLQTILTNHIQNIFWGPAIYCTVAQIWLDIIPSDPETYVQGYFALGTALFLFIYIASKIYVSRRDWKV